MSTATRFPWSIGRRGASFFARCLGCQFICATISSVACGAGSHSLWPQDSRGLRQGWDPNEHRGRPSSPHSSAREPDTYPSTPSPLHTSGSRGPLPPSNSPRIPHWGLEGVRGQTVLYVRGDGVGGEGSGLDVWRCGGSGVAVRGARWANIPGNKVRVLRVRLSWGPHVVAVVPPVLVLGLIQS